MPHLSLLDALLDDRAAALDLVVALSRFRAWCAEEGRAYHFEDLEREARQAMNGLGRTKADIVPAGGETGTSDNHEPDDLPPFLNRRDFGRRVGKSERTVRRWIAAGKLAATPLGIPRSELERLQGGARR